MTTDNISKKSEEVLDMISSMTLLEIVDLTKCMEEKFNVSAAMPTFAAAAAAPGAIATAPTEEKTEFDVYLKEVNPNQKIATIKIVREITGLGLKEAKELVESVQSAPKLLKGGLSKNAAEECKKKVEGVEAKAEIK